MIKNTHQRVGVFIDVQNLYYSAKNLHGAHVDFAKIVKEGLGDRQLIRAIAYVVRTEGEEERPFLDALIKRGIETRERDLQIFFGEQKKQIGTSASRSIVSEYVKSLMSSSSSQAMEITSHF